MLQKDFQRCYKIKYFYLNSGDNSTQELKGKVEEISQKEKEARRKIQEKVKEGLRGSIPVGQWLTNRHSRETSRQKEGGKAP